MASPNTAISYGTAALQVGGGLSRTFGGDKRKVAFLRDNSVLVQFDAVLQEGHQVDAGPTAFPIEDGQTISDHVIIAPTELTLTGIVTDTPIGDRNSLLTEGLVAAYSAAGPLGTLGSAAAISSIKSIYGSQSPSFRAYEILRTLCQGFPNGPNPIPPTPFDVRTALRTYRNMVIRGMQVPRDATTGSALVFNITLTELRIVRPQSLVLPLSKIPDTATLKERLEETNPELTNSYEGGVRDINKIANERVGGVYVPLIGGGA